MTERKKDPSGMPALVSGHKDHHPPEHPQGYLSNVKKHTTF